VVGNWFAFEGFSPEDLGVETWDQLEGTGISKIIENSHLDLDNEAINFLNTIQTNQDTGLSWGYSFERVVAGIEGRYTG
jgi:hypothetical protein